MLHKTNFNLKIYFFEVQQECHLLLFFARFLMENILQLMIFLKKRYHNKLDSFFALRHSGSINSKKSAQNGLNRNFIAPNLSEPTAPLLTQSLASSQFTGKTAKTQLIIFEQKIKWGLVLKKCVNREKHSGELVIICQVVRGIFEGLEKFSKIPRGNLKKP